MSWQMVNFDSHKLFLIAHDVKVHRVKSSPAKACAAVPSMDADLGWGCVEEWSRVETFPGSMIAPGSPKME
jgi:hypothetical protein